MQGLGALVKAALEKQQFAERMGVDGAKAQPHRLFVVMHRLIVVAGVPMGDGAIRARARRCAVRAPAPYRIGKRVAVVAVPLVRDCALVKSAGDGSVLSNDPVKVGNRRREILLPAKIRPRSK